MLWAEGIQQGRRDLRELEDRNRELLPAHRQRQKDFQRKDRGQEQQDKDTKEGLLWANQFRTHEEKDILNVRERPHEKTIDFRNKPTPQKSGEPKIVRSSVLG